MSPAEHHREVAAVFSEKVVGTTDWDAPAPVDGWTARDVVGHLVDWFPGFLEAGTGIRLPSGPSVDDDPAGAWHAHTDAVQRLLDDPSYADAMLTNPHLGEVPADEAAEEVEPGSLDPDLVWGGGGRSAAAALSAHVWSPVWSPFSIRPNSAPVMAATISSCEVPSTL